MKESEEGFSMPLAAPAYAAPPYWARPEWNLLLVFSHADRKALEYEIPEPLVLAPNAMCLAWMASL